MPLEILDPAVYIQQAQALATVRRRIYKACDALDLYDAFPLYLKSTTADGANAGVITVTVFPPRGYIALAQGSDPVASGAEALDVYELVADALEGALE